ncbi:MAG: CBS domain-containing protein [Pirellulales bacterium]|nr:CBS domain-containing protein [Pirellulales bacterium]
MIPCPYCGFENIEGSDECEECGQSLTGQPQPSSTVEEKIFNDRIRDLPPREPLVCSPDTPMSEVVKMLHDHSVGAVTVVDGDDVVGIFSERDALMRLNTDYQSLLDKPVDHYMTPSPVTLEGRDKIAYALHKMDLGGYRHIPITDEGKLTGMISVRLILRYINDKLLTVDAAL